MVINPNTLLRSTNSIGYICCYGIVLMCHNGWRYGLVKPDHNYQSNEIKFQRALLTIPLVSVSFLSVGGTKH